MRTPTELYEYLQQNKETISEEEWRDIFKEMLKMLFEDEYKKMVVDVFEDIKAEIEKAMGDFYYSEHDLGVRQGFRFALEIIDKHTKGESE